MKNNQKNITIQVDRSHYFTQYDNIERFISYYYQITSITKTNPENILEIGVGNKTVSNYLKEAGYTIITCDFDKELKPDIVADIKNLPLKNNSFDTVVACEILEHLPFSEFESTIKELRRVTRRTLIISLPYSCAYLENNLKINIPFFQKKLNFSIKIPYFFIKIKLNNKNKEHYWELGSKDCSKSTIRNIIKKYFNISSEFHPPFNSNHYFFILNK
ncbi:MAG: methyltransferase type 11 [uncultured bacterium]|nr:MAG: methyltransferase type 11 [uncultured bacterium]